MTLAKTLLSELSDWKPSGAGRHVLSLPNADGWTTRIEADHSGVVGCLLREISMTRDDATDAPANVQAWATGVADRVSGLLEDLKVIEVDAERGEAVLRSDDPTKNGDTVAYYEVVLTGTDTANVARYQANRTVGTKREQIPFALTHEVVAKLVGDIAG